MTLSRAPVGKYAVTLFFSESARAMFAACSPDSSMTLSVSVSVLLSVSDSWIPSVSVVSAVMSDSFSVSFIDAVTSVALVAPSVVSSVVSFPGCRMQGSSRAKVR